MATKAKAKIARMDAKVNNESEQAAPQELAAPQLSQEQMKVALENTINIANFFGSAIETQANQLDKLNLPSKLSIVWIIRNRKKFFEFIELIVSIIKEVRAKIKEIKDAQAQQPTTED